MAIKAIQFPTAIDDNDSLFLVANNVTTTLNGDFTSVDTALTVVDGSGFPTSGFLSIGAEIVHYTSKSGNIFSGCTRAVDGTLLADHFSGDEVRLNVIAIHHNRLKDVILAIENALGISLANVVKSTGDQTVAGIKTFTSFPVTPSTAPSANYEVPNKKYVDDSVTYAA